ncbi:hypothetical protein [Leptolyngbya iicbica]|uniref:Uncharacterized protein n=2 Tax=Cyanophyceae TaxID=3028117 RepID=A0A4Q7EAJ2_9CYAN|nr:hypothetical protein [Leptolyngbya sp. LK]RZM79682.1 hypothetical protein DYY88_13355 [Leptolyngbya sp. LK]
MVPIEKGFYLVNVFNLGKPILDLNGFHRRESIVQYLRTFKYQQIEFSSYNAWCNEFGSVIAFKKIDSCHSISDAMEVYNSSETFDPIYRKFVEDAKENLKFKGKDSDYSFVFGISDSFSKDEISWNRVFLRENYLNFFLLLEAIFVYQLCKLLEAEISRVPGEIGRFSWQRKLVEYTENLFSLQYPSQFLIYNIEIDFMQVLYSAWGLDSYIASLRSRFEQSISSYTFYWDYLEKQKSDTMNILLAAIAILSLYEALPVLTSVFPEIDMLLVNVILIVLAVSAILWAFWGIAIHWIGVSTYKTRNLVSNISIKRKVVPTTFEVVNTFSPLAPSENQADKVESEESLLEKQQNLSIGEELCDLGARFISILNNFWPR